jgi:hypothetical protein
MEPIGRTPHCQYKNVILHMKFFLLLRISFRKRHPDARRHPFLLRLWVRLFFWVSVICSLSHRARLGCGNSRQARSTRRSLEGGNGMIIEGLEHGFCYGSETGHRWAGDASQSDSKIFEIGTLQRVSEGRSQCFPSLAREPRHGCSVSID